MSIKCPICCKEFEDGVEVCPACGFKFSGATQEFRPIEGYGKDSKEKIDTIGAAKPPLKKKVCPSLRVVKGPQGEIVLPLAKDSMTVGRSPNSDIFLNDRTVSRNHATITKNGDVYQIADNNSFNGVWVNNENVTESELKDGDYIQIGLFVLRFEEN